MWFALFQTLIVDRSQRHVWKYTSTGFVCLVVLCTALAMTLLSTTMYRHFSEQSQHIKHIQQQQRTTSDNQNKMNNYETLARKHPEAFVEYQKHRFDEVFTVDMLKERLTSIQKKLKIDSLNIQHEPAIRAKDGVSTLSATIDLKVMHDRQFFQFLEQLQKSNIGFFVVKNFDLKRVESKKKPPIFEGRITFQWFARQG